MQFKAIKLVQTRDGFTSLVQVPRELSPREAVLGNVAEQTLDDVSARFLLLPAVDRDLQVFSVTPADHTMLTCH